MLNNQNQILAPFSESQVDKLNLYQQGLSSVLQGHPFTCPHKGNTPHVTDLLIATPEGWMCPCCEYSQNWAHSFMAKDQEESKEDGKFDVLIQKMLETQGIDAKEILKKRAQDAYDAYKKIYMSNFIDVGQSAFGNALTKRLWQYIPFALTSLNRYLLSLEGVAFTHGLGISVDESWTSIEDAKPENDDPVHVVLSKTYIMNPLHPGFGASAWISNGTFTDGYILTTDGYAKYWRNFSTKEKRVLQEEGISKLQVEVDKLEKELTEKKLKLRKLQAKLI